MRRHSGGAFQFRQDRFRQLLAEFDTPLVERVNVPEDSLSEDLVLIKRNQTSERTWRELLKQDRIRRSITCKDFVWHELVDRFW